MDWQKINLVLFLLFLVALSARAYLRRRARLKRKDPPGRGADRS